MLVIHAVKLLPNFKYAPQYALQKIEHVLSSRCTIVEIEHTPYSAKIHAGQATSRYSAPEIEELLAAANRVCEVNPRKTPALTILKRKTG